MRLVDIDDIRVMKFLSEEDDPSESDGEREYRNGWNDALTAINDIQPSAEPTEASCWGCNCPKMERMLPSADPELATNLQQSCNQLATDTIFRQAAIEALKEHEDDKGYLRGDFEEILEALPSAEPSSKRGWYQKGYRDGQKAQQDMKRSFAEYVPFITTWLMDYQVRAAELKGRYTAYEVLGWVVNDWMKENPERPDEP